MSRTYELTLYVKDSDRPFSLDYNSETDVLSLHGEFPYEVSSAFDEMVGTLRELVAKETVGSKVERMIEAMQSAANRMAERIPPPPPPPAPEVVNFQPAPTQPEAAQVSAES